MRQYIVYNIQVARYISIGMSILINRMRLMAQLVQLQENIPQYTGQNKLTVNATVNIIGYNWFLIKKFPSFQPIIFPLS